MMAIWQCKRCGKCCLRWGSPEATEADFKRWEKENRLDLLHHPSIDPKWHGVKGDICCCYEIFDSVKDMRKALKELEAIYSVHFLFGGYACCCPFLKHLRNGNYACLILETKPEICRNFQCNETEVRWRRQGNE
jgi:Fe-S-cluster containining protein